MRSIRSEAWDRLEQRTHLLTAAASEVAAWEIIVRQARPVLRAYSTSFFLVKGLSLRPTLTGKSLKHAQPIFSEHE